MQIQNKKINVGVVSLDDENIYTVVGYCSVNEMQI
jgi:hypothetical protein